MMFYISPNTKTTSFFLGRHIEDLKFLNQLDCNLKGVDLGSSDWLNPGLADNFIGSEKKYDIVMNANWGALKRHHVLFKALSRIEEKLKVALVGFEWNGRTKDEIETLANYYGVLDEITFFEKISFNDVMKINSQSRVAILLSRKEGANRAIPEALFCDTPAIVLESNVGGQVRNIVPETGLLCTDDNLQSKIIEILDNETKFTPRRWANENISCFISTEKLNSILKSNAINEGFKWTEDIQIRTNSPDLRYYDDYAAEKCKLVNGSLASYILKS